MGSCDSYTNTLANDTWTTTGFGPAMTPLQAGYVRQQPAVAWILTSNSSEATRGAQMLHDCQVSTAAAFGFFGLRVHTGGPAVSQGNTASAAAAAEGGLGESEGPRHFVAVRHSNAQHFGPLRLDLETMHRSSFRKAAQASASLGCGRLGRAAPRAWTRSQERRASVPSVGPGRPGSKQP